MAPRKKAAKKRGPKSANGANGSVNIGHNSNGAQIDAEILKIAKQQRALDKERATARTDFNERQSKITARLKEIGVSRKAFKLPYDNWNAIQDADDEDAVKQRTEKNVLYLAEQRRCFDALSAGDQIDWIHMIENAEKIQQQRAEAEAAELADAADGAEDAEDTEAQL